MLGRRIVVSEETDLVELRANLSNVFDGDENVLIVFDFVDDSFHPKYFGLVLFLEMNAQISITPLAPREEDSCRSQYVCKISN